MKILLVVQALRNLTSPIAFLRKLLEGMPHKNQGVNEDVRCRKWDSTREGDEGSPWWMVMGYPGMTPPGIENVTEAY